MLSNDLGSAWIHVGHMHLHEIQWIQVPMWLHEAQWIRVLVLVAGSSPDFDSGFKS